MLALLQSRGATRTSAPTLSSFGEVMIVWGGQRVVSVMGAVIGAVTLFAINELVSRTTYAFPCAARALEGDPTLLISEGKPIHQALRRSGISLPELRASARRQGFADLGAVHTAILETNGIVTMFRADEPGSYHPAAPGGLRIAKRRRSGS